MNIDRVVMAFAGTMVLASIVLSQIHSSNWLWLTAFVGANLLQSGFTRFCPAESIMVKLGMKRLDAPSCGHPEIGQR